MKCQHNKDICNSNRKYSAENLMLWEKSLEKQLEEMQEEVNNNNNEILKNSVELKSFESICCEFLKIFHEISQTSKTNKIKNVQLDPVKPEDVVDYIIFNDVTDLILKINTNKLDINRNNYQCVDINNGCSDKNIKTILAEPVKIVGYVLKKNVTVPKSVADGILG